jgi:tRNA(Ile)-lysidine synthetase-like protein
MDAVRQALLEASDRGLTPRGASILLAVSGGADSMALLYAAAEVASTAGWTRSVGHVHHGWRAREADRDLLFVAGHARRLGLPFFYRRRDARGEARQLGLSPEAAARRVRYEALFEMAREAGASLVATAHQRDDRIESHLLAKQRRGGLASLAGPRERRADGVVRPMLSVSRREIVEYLSARGIAWRRDRTNGDLSLARNRLRRELVVEDGKVEALASRVESLARRREELDRSFETELRPAIAFGRNVVIARAPLLESSPAELRRKAVLECAIPFSRPGRPPFTGREREQIVALLATGRDFRFEAGRRIRFRRRGDRFSVRLAPTARQTGNNR